MAEASLPAGIAVIFARADVPTLVDSLREVGDKAAVTVIALKFGQVNGDFADMCLDLRAAGIGFEQARVEGLPVRPDDESVDDLIRGISRAYANHRANGPLLKDQLLNPN